MSDETINSISASNYSNTLELSCYGCTIRVKFNWSRLKRDNTTYSHGKIVNVYFIYEISKNFNISSYPKLENCSFGAISSTKNVDIGEGNYSEYGIGFNRKGTFSFSNGFGRIV